MDDVERELGLSRERLVEMALLLGSDYTEVSGTWHGRRVREAGHAAQGCVQVCEDSTGMHILCCGSRVGRQLPEVCLCTLALPGGYK